MSRFFRDLRSDRRLPGAGLWSHPLSVPGLDERETFVHQTLAGALIVGAAGVVLLLLFGRWAWAAAFGAGAALSLGNFHLITRAVRRLVEPDAGQASRHLWKGTTLRFLIAGIALFLAVVVLRLNILALVAGLLLTQLGMIGAWLLRSARTST